MNVPSEPHSTPTLPPLHYTINYTNLFIAMFTSLHKHLK